MTQTVYVPVEASGVNTYAVNIPSGADTTSGYYLSYNVGGENSGFTGISWYLDKPGNPFSGFQGISNNRILREQPKFECRIFNVDQSSWRGCCQ